MSEDVAAARLAAVEAVATRWSEVLIECKESDPRWIFDQSVTVLDSALKELCGALGRPTARPGGDDV